MLFRSRRVARHRELTFDEQRHQPIFDSVAGSHQLLTNRPCFLDFDHGCSRSLTDRSAQQRRVTGLQVIELARQVLGQQRRDCDEFAHPTGKLRACLHDDLRAELSEVVRRIDSMQKSELESHLMMRYAEEYQPFVAVGLFFMILGFALLPSWRRAS